MTSRDTQTAARRGHSEMRAAKRDERLRREQRRLVRQRRMLLALLGVLLVAGAAFALRPALQPHARSGAGVPASVATTASVDASETASTPATAPISKPATQATIATPTAPASTSPIANVKPLSPKPGVKTIVVDKSSQWVTLYKANGAPVDRFRCASGVIYPRIGTYKVWGRKLQSWALADDSTFYYFTKFATSDKGNSIGFHSIPVLDGKLVGGLGKPISHGCVRLDKKKAHFIYDWAPNGTRVIVKK